MDERFRKIEIPVIPENTKIACRPLLLLRQDAGPNGGYQVEDIIQRLLYSETSDNDHDKNFKLYLIYEIAANSKLRQQLSLNLNFNEWLHQASKIEIVD